MIPGDVVWAAAGQKRRRCVVLRVRADAAVVVLPGTSTRREHLPHVVVVAGSQAWKAMRLENTTYFYASGLVAVGASALERSGGLTPPEVLLRLRQLVGEVPP